MRSNPSSNWYWAAAHQFISNWKCRAELRRYLSVTHPYYGSTLRPQPGEWKWTLLIAFFGEPTNPCPFKLSSSARSILQFILITSCAQTRCRRNPETPPFITIKGNSPTTSLPLHQNSLLLRQTKKKKKAKGYQDSSSYEGHNAHVFYGDRNQIGSLYYDWNFENFLIFGERAIPQSGGKS